MSSFATIDTPVGPFTVIVNPDGAVLASGWTAAVEQLGPLIHPSLRPASLVRKADLGEVTRAVTEYHAGDVAAINSIGVLQKSGEFLTHAWNVLRTVAPHEPISYAEFAFRAGRPAAVRAAASACARNAAALFVPCHRVIRTGGDLGRFRYGVPIKRWLVDHEGAGH